MNTTDVVFRTASEADLASIVALLAADPLGAKRENAASPLPQSYRDAFHAIMSDPNQILCVGELAGDVVATLQLTFIRGISNQGAVRAQIESVRVIETMRSRRIGEALITWAISESRARGCGTVQLTTDVSRKDAHRFYSRLGFTPSHVGFKLKL